jgi:hypothetical protein
MIRGSLDDHGHIEISLQLVSEPTLVELLRSDDWFKNFSEIYIFNWICYFNQIMYE